MGSKYPHPHQDFLNHLPAFHLECCHFLSTCRHQNSLQTYL
jgi:hypothetical protein